MSHASGMLPVCVHLSSRLPHSHCPPFHTRLFLSQRVTEEQRTVLPKPFQSQLDLVLLQSNCREHLQPRAPVGLPATSASASKQRATTEPKKHIPASAINAARSTCIDVLHISKHCSSRLLPTAIFSSPPPAGFYTAGTCCCGRRL